MYKVDITERDKKVFGKVVDFAKASPANRGFYTVLFDFEDEGPDSYMRLYMSLLMEKFDVKDDNFRRNFGRSFLDVPYDDVLRHSVEGDGSVVVDRKLLVVDDHRFFSHVKGEALRELKRLQPEIYEPSGGGHNFLQFGSAYPGITSFVLSAERGTVKAYKRGMQIAELTYRP